MGSCVSCGSWVPDGQASCSMCFGDPSHGSDGYYENYMRLQEEEAKVNKNVIDGKVIETVTPDGAYSDSYTATLETSVENPINVNFTVIEEHSGYTIITGNVKWDGCMNIDCNHHICSLAQLNVVNNLIVSIYEKSYEMMKPNADASAFSIVYNDLPF